MSILEESLAVKNSLTFQVMGSMEKTLWTAARSHEVVSRYGTDMQESRSHVNVLLYTDSPNRRLIEDFLQKNGSGVSYGYNHVRSSVH